MHVIVAGGGLAGLVAASRAAELGAEVTLLEKGDRLGGSLIYSSGYIWSYRDLDTFRREAPGGEAPLQEVILKRLEAGLDWLEAAGIPAVTRETGNPLTFGARFKPSQIVSVLSEKVRALPGRIRFSTALDGLMEGPEGTINGVHVTVRGGGRRILFAHRVILATGGFQGNLELVERHIARQAERMWLRANPWSTGDGFLAALGIGALASRGLSEFYGRNLPAPPASFTPEQFVEVSQLYGRYAVALNVKGERFTDESADWSETALTQATARQPGLRAWYVLDAEGMKARIRERTAAQMVETARSVGGTVIQAGTLEDLAAKLGEHGLPAPNVLRTLKEYNAAVTEGSAGDLQVPRSEPSPAICTPPFVAIEVAPSITHTLGGLAVDERCRVLRRAAFQAALPSYQAQDCPPIPRLYAAGVEAGGVATGGYASGLAQALVFGKLAAETALEI